MSRNGQRQSNPVESPVAVWQASYASLAMILVVFFVMLVSYSQISGRSALQIRAALGGKVDRTAGTDRPGTPEAPTITGEQRAVEAKLLAETGGVLRGALENANLSRSAVLERTRSGWRMVLGMDVLFTEGRETIREPVQLLLREVGKAAAKGNLAVRIEAFGAASGTGDASASWATPALRAASLIEFLEEDGARVPVSIRGSRAAKPAAGSSADSPEEMVVSLVLPEAER